MKNITLCVALFSLSSGLASAQTFTTLLKFAAIPSTLGSPASPLVQAADGTLYGTTASVIFKVQPDGSGLTALKSIFGVSGLALDGSTLYGTIKYGGSAGE